MLKSSWREGDPVAGGLVVLEIVMVVADEEHRRRPHADAIDLGDLRLGQALDDPLVVRAHDRQLGIEEADLAVEGPHELAQLQVRALQPALLVPVDVVPLAMAASGRKDRARSSSRPPQRGGRKPSGSRGPGGR
jgi:hypothetical protein